MHRIDHATATGEEFTEGNPSIPTEATVVTADWLNAIQGELAHFIESEGIELDKEVNTQLALAITLAVARIAAPLIQAAQGKRYVNAGITDLTKADTLLDSSGGSFSVRLPANPTVGWSVELIDAANAWGANPVTVLRNGKTIMGLAEDLVLNKSDQRFMLRWDGATWKLL